MEDEELKNNEEETEATNTDSDSQEDNYSKNTKNSPAMFVVLIVLVLGGIYFYKNMNSNKTMQTKEENKTTNTETTKEITQEELAKHSTKEDCWLQIDSKVYDVTNFVSKHPGKDAILFGCGKDATAMFNKRPDGTSHSDRARVTMTQFQIGTVK